MNKKDLSSIFISLIIIVVGLFVSNLIINTNKILLSTYENSIDDNAYIVNAYKGIEKYKDQAKVSKLEVLNKKLFKEKINKKINNGIDFIWIVEPNSAQEVYKLAKENEEVTFCVFDKKYSKKLNNLCGIYFEYDEVAFLAGYLAGQITQTNTVGFIGGDKEQKEEEIEKYYIKGIKYANPNCNIITDYANTYSDSMLGSNMAQVQYNQGADIIFETGGLTGSGVISKSKELGKWVIAIDTNKESLAPDNVLASITRDTEKVTQTITKKYLENENIGNKNYNFSIENEIMDIEMTKNVDVETKTNVELLKSKMLNKTFDINNY